MATRATYQIDGTTFYCHWDGYPTGAAHRFANAVAAMTQPAKDGRLEPIADKRGGFAFAFIRGNDDAEPTKSHDAHGDTEWRYTVKSMPNGALQITVAALGWNSAGQRQEPRVRWTGDLAEWLEARRRDHAAELVDWAQRNQKDMTFAQALAETFPRVVRVEQLDRYVQHATEWKREPTYTYATEPHAREIARLTREQGERFGEGNVNRGIYLERADAWDAALVDTAQLAAA
jgi:hypothetical protein